MSNLITLEGELNWVRCNEPEETPYKDSKTGETKKQWKCNLRPTSESLTQILDLQSLGVKNKLSKTPDGKGYSVNFNRPTKHKGKALDAPKVFKADGTTLLTDFIGNGSRGKVMIELYEHGTPTGGKASAARLHSIIVTDFKPYVPNIQA